MIKAYKIHKQRHSHLERSDDCNDCKSLYGLAYRFRDQVSTCNVAGNHTYDDTAAYGDGGVPVPRDVIERSYPRESRSRRYVGIKEYL